MRKIVECVPNFSEGRDKKVLDAIANEIKTISEVTLLDVDPGEDTNRTVFTFVGSPKGVEEAALIAMKKASELIDMTTQTGAHPRMGATDVCPFIPVQGVTMDECAEIAKRVGKRAGEELGIPIFLYENAATKPEWKNLANVRKGEYEALEKKFKTDDFTPDFGPNEFKPKIGATAISAREFLLAYNINLNTKDKKIAKDIALDLKEKGRAIRDENGKIKKDENGNKILKDGRFNNCKAIGWYVDDFKCAQISINLTNYNVTNFNDVFDEACKLAIEKGYRVTGSEVVGLVPRKAIINAGNHYLKKQMKVGFRYQTIQGMHLGIPESEIVDIAIKSLGLNDVTNFDPNEKIIEYRIKRDSDKDYLADKTVADFTHELSSDSPAPGGGSVAALSGALSAALSSMVSNLSYKIKYKNNIKEIVNIGVEAQELKRTFLDLIDRDTDVFNQYMAVNKKDKIAEQAAAKAMTNIPFETLEYTKKLMNLAERIEKVGNKNALSDAGVAAINANAAAKAAFLNIKINVPSVKDEAYVKDIMSKAKLILDEVNKRALALEDKISADL